MSTPRAEQDFEVSLAVDPDNPLALHEYGLLHLRSGRAQEALRLFDRSIELSAEKPPHLVNRADAHHALQDYDRAEADDRRALALRPDSSEAHFGLGLCHVARERWAEAEKEFTKAIESGYARGHMNRGAARVRLGRLEDALADFERAAATETDLERKRRAEENARTVRKALKEERREFRLSFAVVRRRIRPEHGGCPCRWAHRVKDLCFVHVHTNAPGPADPG